MQAACKFLRFSFAAGDVDFAVFVIPRGDLVPPPQLARNAPVLDVVHPLVICINPVFGDEAHCAAVHGVFGFLRQAHAFEFGFGLAALGRGVHGDKPLVGQHRLNHGTGAVAFRRHQFVRLGFHQQAGRVQIGHDLFARFKAVQPRVFFRQPAHLRGRAAIIAGLRFGKDFRIQTQYADEFGAVPFADFVVVKIVRRRDFHAA